MKLILSIAAGGAIGALGRHYAMTLVGHILGTAFPYGTVVVNVVGSFILGVLIETMALVWSPPPELRALIVLGGLGAFTTFSTFSMDTILLFERGQLMQAGAYVVVSVTLSVLAFAAGMFLLRHILT